MERTSTSKASHLATCADPASLQARTSKLNNSDKAAYYKAQVRQFADILLEQTTFPKKPLRKTHLRSQYFTELFGLTSAVTTPKANDVFELYLIKRPLIDPVIAIFGK